MHSQNTYIMKHIYSTLFLFSFILSLQAQIVFDQDDLGVPGTTYPFITDTLPTGLTPGPAGMNETWNFTALNVHEFNDITYEDPANTTDGSFFPNSELAVDLLGNGAFFYLDVDPAYADILGFSGDVFGVGFPITLPYTDPQRQFNFPVTYNTTSTDDYSFTATLDAALLGVTQADSIRLTRTGTVTTEVDGYGTINTPFGSYATMRTHVVDTYEDVIEGFTFGTWFPFQTINTTEERYEWLAEETNGPVLTMDVDPNTGDATSINYANLNTTVVAPDALFSYTDNTNGNFDFVDESTNDPSSFAWDFGDGNTSSMQNPNHVYAQSGTYEVCLFVNNVGGTDSYCEMITVAVAPTSSFATADGSNEGEVLFTDLSTNDPTSWAWDFGDGNTSTLQNPTNTYAQADTYNVCLVVTNAAGMDTYCEMITVVFAPIAAFDSADGTSDGEVVFTDLSTNSPTAWSWDFGDNNTSNLQNPTNTYTASGTYNVCLVASNAGGSSVETCMDIVVTTTGIFDQQNDVSLDIYPNPASEFIQIDIEENTGEFQLDIYDALGKKVHSLDDLKIGGNTIMLNELSVGYYYFQIMNKENKETTVRKIMIQ